MKKYSHYFVIILCLVGGYHLLSFLIGIGSNIWANFDDGYKLDKLAEQYNDYSKRAYSLGRLWGDAAATEASLDKEPNDKNEAAAMANKYIDERSFFNCWGPSDGDCDDIPTDERLRNFFKVEYGSKMMPINSFKSGFYDAFFEYFNL